jgi:predicted oxidoreductase
MTTSSSATKEHRADVVVIGGGLAGICVALELLEAGKSVCLLERAGRERFGGLAKRSFGGLFFVNSPEQRKGGIADSEQLAYDDWVAYGELAEHETLERSWAKTYVERCTADVRDWMHGRHITWGTGQRIIEVLAGQLLDHGRAEDLDVRFDHRVTGFEREGDRFVACVGETAEGERFRASGDAIVLAAGGIAGNLDLVRKHWPSQWGTAPRQLLNGSIPEADGHLIEAVEREGARVSHLERMWNYAAGVEHWDPKHDGHGLSLVPPKSALWLDAEGRRFENPPLVGNFDTRYLVEAVARSKHQYSWQVLNMKIASKEFAVSGAEFNRDVRDRKLFSFLSRIIFGCEPLVREFVENCPDFVTASSLPELAKKMNTLTGDDLVDPGVLTAEIARYDGRVRRGGPYHADDQLRRIAQAREYRGDRLRTCKFAAIDDPGSRPLIAIRERILTRKSLGGVRTDLGGQVLDAEDQPLEGLFAVGEAAGFGGGGIHGLRALEGTFLGTCVLTGRRAARAIAKGDPSLG